MRIRFRFKDWGLAQRTIEKMPASMRYEVLTDRTTDIYIEVDEKDADYVENYLYTPYRDQ